MLSFTNQSISNRWWQKKQGSTPKIGKGFLKSEAPEFLKRNIIIMNFIVMPIQCTHFNLS